MIEKSLAYESERLRAERAGESLELSAGIDLPPEFAGKEREAVVRVRVNQTYFRKMVLARYEYRCCITGLTVQPLLTASHIVPWSEAEELRLDPRNGLCLNALHDRAFDCGLLFIDDGFRVRVAAGSGGQENDAARDFILRFDGAPLRLPDGIAPSRELLRRHRQRFGFDDVAVAARDR